MKPCFYIVLFFYYTSFAQAQTDTEGIFDKSQQVVYGQSHTRALASVKQSQKKLESLYHKLLKTIQNNPDIFDSKHKSSMLSWLEKAQQNWPEYVYTHCMFLSYVYAYPATSRLASVEFNVCKTRLTRQRINFFEDMLREYEFVQGEWPGVFI